MPVLNKKKSFAKLLFLITGLLFYAGFSFAQPTLPQRAITITPSQTIHFGTFCVTGPGGGTVTVGWNGSRTSTGSIALLSIAPTARPAIFDIKLCQGRNVIITYDPTAPLTGSGGGTCTMDIGPTEKGGNGASFPTNNDCNFVTVLRVGGTLHIPENSPAGSYTGNFDITFNQE